MEIRKAKWMCNENTFILTNTAGIKCTSCEQVFSNFGPAARHFGMKNSQDMAHAYQRLLEDSIIKPSTATIVSLRATP